MLTSGPTLKLQFLRSRKVRQSSGRHWSQSITYFIVGTHNLVRTETFVDLLRFRTFKLQGYNWKSIFFGGNAVESSSSSTCLLCGCACHSSSSIVVSLLMMGCVTTEVWGFGFWVLKPALSIMDWIWFKQDFSIHFPISWFPGNDLILD